MENCRNNIDKKHKVVYFLILFVWIDTVSGQACSSPDISSLQFEFGLDNDIPIEATFAGIIAEYIMNNTLSISSTENSLMRTKYIDAELDEDSILRIITTSDFASFEENESKKEIVLIIDFVCLSGTTQLMFKQKIKESNNHSPTFTQDIYEMKIMLPLPMGFDLTFYQEISARDIDLYNNNVVFTSVDSDIVTVGTSDRPSEDGKTFYATLILNRQLLQIKDKLEFTIIGTDSGNPPRNGSAIVRITGDDVYNFIPAPLFEKVIYRGLLDDNKMLTIENPRIIMETYSSEISYELSEGDVSFFSISINSNTINITLSRILTDEDLRSKTYLMCTIVATRPSVESGSTVVLVDFPITTPEPPVLVPMFEKSLYKGYLDADRNLTIEKIVLVAETYNSNVTFEIKDESGLFSFSSLENILTISLIRDISEEDLETIDAFTFFIVAIQSDEFGETVVLINLPKIVCPECPTTTTMEPSTCPPPIICPEIPTTTPCPVVTTQEPITCSECPTTEAPVVDYTPIFENKHYNFWIKSNAVGKIGSVLAITSSTDIIEYSVALLDEELALRILINKTNGELTLIDIIDAGTYKFEVIATNLNDNSKGNASIQLTVDIVNICIDPNSTVTKSLLIKYWEENKIHTEVLQTQMSDCYYQIVGMIPSDKSYFEIIKDSNTIVSINMDREDNTFLTYAVPQIQVTLKLICEPIDIMDVSIPVDYINSTHEYINSDQYISPSGDDGRWYVLTNDIDYARDITVLTVIIEDVNDNYPEFENPSNNSVIGYPVPYLAEQIMPSNLIQVYATDKDAGINAKIKYSLVANNQFQINSENGNIYPINNAMENKHDVLLIISAIDKDGAMDGLKTDISLRVLALEIHHLTVLTIDGDHFENIDVILEYIRNETNTNVMVLQSAFISTTIKSIKEDAHVVQKIVQIISHIIFRKQGQTFRTFRMIVYAFNNNNILIESTEMQKKLELMKENIKLTILPYVDLVEVENYNVDMILLIISFVLGILLIILGIGMFLMWWFKIRPYKYETMIDDTSSQHSLGSEGPEVKVERSTVNNSRFDVQKRDSLTLHTAVVHEQNGDHNKSPKNSSLLEYNINDNSITSENDNNNLSREQRKSQSVTFNELVERIDIEKDPTRHTEFNMRM